MRQFIIVVSTPTGVVEFPLSGFRFSEIRRRVLLALKPTCRLLAILES